jgi:hypothetical protein
MGGDQPPHPTFLIGGNLLHTIHLFWALYGPQIVASPTLTLAFLLAAYGVAGVRFVLENPNS